MPLIERRELLVDLVKQDTTSFRRAAVFDKIAAMPNRYIFLLFGVLLPTLLLAQASGGSPYSSFGLGDQSQLGWSQNRGLAGLKAAIRSDQYFSVGNPASYTGIASPTTVLFTTGFHVDINRIITSEEAVTQRDGGLTHLAMWVRPAKNYAFTIGMEPFSTVKYTILADAARDVPVGNYSSLNEGTGGLSRVFWGHGFQLPFGISVGANAGAIFGKISKEEQLFSEDPLQAFRVSSNNYLSGYNFDVGLQWELPLQKKGKEKLVFGATYRHATTLTNTLEAELTTLTDTLITDGVTEKGNFTIPKAFSVGLSYYTPKWMVSAEGSYEAWSETENDSAADWLDVWSFGVATEFSLSKTSRSPYKPGPRYRLGVKYQDSKLAIGGTSFNELITTAGISLPYKRGQNHLDLSYSYHHRGTLDNNLMLENRHSIGISISLRDVWFRQRKFY